MVRFDDRRRKQGGDGDDFRDFVGELLRIVPGFGYPISRDSGGVDGGIDLYCAKEGLVVECKHVGADVKSESERIDQEWAQVREKFDHNLVSENGIAAPARAPYEPWADSSQPIKRYIFATSARLANETRQRDLATAIREFFRENIGARPGYEHLREIEVDVIDWTNIESRLADHPALVFKWLKQWPSGFVQLDDVDHPGGFREFLHSRKLPYLARAAWSPPSGLSHAWTEATLADELAISDVRDPFVVLIGQGGVGKTRLGLEVARRMGSAGWWTIHADGLRATAGGLREMLGESSRPLKVVLFVDYLEIWPDFEAFANEIFDLNQSTGHQIRAIATCRASYRDRLPPFIHPRNVGGDAAIEVAYSKAVTLQILSALSKQEAQNLAEKCRHNLALAAFLLFLRQERPDRFAAEMSALREEPDFEAWIVRRLRNAGLVNPQIPAAVLAACDFPVTAFDALAKINGGDANYLRQVLVADKWMERREATDGIGAPVWAAFHDVFVDVVLSRALDSAPDRDDAIDRLLEHADMIGVFRQTLTSLGRLKQSATLAAVDWRSRLLEAERRRPGLLADHARLVLTNTLLTPEDRLYLVAANNAVREAIARDIACDVGLALTAAALSDADPVIFDQVLTPLLDNAVARGHQSNMVLRLAYQARPVRYRSSVLNWVTANPRLFQTHFLLKVWLDRSIAELKAGSTDGATHIADVQDPVRDWLVAFEFSRNATFVFASWLDAAAAIGGERAAAMVGRVETHLDAWLKQGEHAISDNARFVYKSWLNAAAAIGGERAAAMVGRVETHVDAWLDHGEQAISDVAHFVYKSWLDVAAAIGGDRAAAMVGRVETHIDAWLNHGEHAISDDAPFVYKSWLDVAAAIGGERAATMVGRVETHVDAWLNHGERSATTLTSFTRVGLKQQMHDD